MKLAQKKQYYLKALFNNFQWNKHVKISLNAQTKSYNNLVQHK